MRFSLACLPVLAIASPALAEPSLHAAPAEELPVQLGVNSPISWFNGTAYGASVAYGFAHHFAVRANYAKYDEDGPTGAIIGEIMGGESASYRGGIEDTSAGVVWYPRRLWSGATVELAALRRQRDSSVRDEFDETATDTRTYAGRALVGWSWQLGYHAYVAFAYGLSVGRERGYETRTPELGMSTRSTVDRAAVETEGYLRFGFAFGR